MFLVVTIDTEEDDWGDPFSEPSVANIERIPEVHSIFERYGIPPTYLIDFPVASAGRAVEILGQIFAEGRCEIGAHLHPWVTPPIDADRRSVTMLGNLTLQEQDQKIQRLTETIESAFGARPRSFRAGRWGLGTQTPRLLVKHGYQVDSSVTPFVSWKAFDDGPSFENFPHRPYWPDVEGDISRPLSRGPLLEVPVTIGFNRMPFELCHRVYRWMSSPRVAPIHLHGLAHRTGLLRKIWLSPEISPGREMFELACVVSRKAIDVLNLMFHSPTLQPGLTPFVRTLQDRQRFDGELEHFFELLFGKFDVKPLTLSGYWRLAVSGSDA